MTTIEEAIKLVKTSCKPIQEAIVIPLEKSCGFLLSEDIYAPINMPPFRQSAMDGYALNLHNKLSYHLVGEIKAGENYEPILKKGDAVRIFTGAPVPASANAVIMQEKVTTNNTVIQIEHSVLKENNIRPRGEQVKTGDLALEKGSKLTPAAIGYLASLGISEVPVYRKPSIAIVVIGNELIESGQGLTYGKIYESNSKMLLSALYGLKFYDVSTHKTPDDHKEVVTVLNRVLNENDIVLISGGISVGKYDFVRKALHELRVKELFYRVKQKPGKPLFFGKKGITNIFALPGNPAAALTCFYIYVFSALQKMTAMEPTELPRVTAKALSKFTKHGNRPQFLKAIYKNGHVELLDGQSSAMQQTFAHSNALVFMPETISHIEINDMVEVILLPV